MPSVETVVATGREPLRMPVWPMAASAAIGVWVLDFLASWLPRGSMSRVGLVILALLLLLSAVMVCGFVARGLYSSLLPRGRAVATPVVRSACLVALWIPAWVLFVETSSLLMIAGAIFCLATLGYLMKRCELENVPAATALPPHEPGAPFLFNSVPLVRVLLPSLLLVALLDAAIALAANYQFGASSLAASLFAGVVAWRAASRRVVAEAGTPAAAPKAAIPGAGQAGIALAAFVLTLVALLPYLRVSQRGFDLRGPKLATKDRAASAKNDSNDGYVGIIMLPLTQAQKTIVAPVKRDFTPHFGVKLAEPMEIPFDGQYWYFKWPEKRPRPSARVVRGSTTKTQVRSSDRYPLLMEAHQKLAEPLDLGCCSAMQLVVENADQLSGAIALELWVKKQADAKAAAKERVNAVAPEAAPRYLGTVTIPSSELPSAQRPNATGRLAEEKLRFPIPAAMDGTLFDEITVVVRTSPERARMGAKVAIKKFVLEP